MFGWSRRDPRPGSMRDGDELVGCGLAIRDYATNPPLYPRLHEYFRASQVPLLAIWGAEDEIFGPDGARAFAKDLENAQIQLVPGGGHFLLESHLDTVTDAMRTFLGQHLSPRE
ncbi:alpha/beta fold hydrolase [Streptomyces griseoincarnatus]